MLDSMKYGRDAGQVLVSPITLKCINNNIVISTIFKLAKSKTIGIEMRFSNGRVLQTFTIPTSFIKHNFTFVCAPLGISKRMWLCVLSSWAFMM